MGNPLSTTLGQSTQRACRHSRPVAQARRQLRHHSYHGSQAPVPSQRLIRPRFSIVNLIFFSLRTGLLKDTFLKFFRVSKPLPEDKAGKKQFSWSWNYSNSIRYCMIGKIANCSMCFFKRSISGLVYDHSEKIPRPTLKAITTSGCSEPCRTLFVMYTVFVVRTRR